MNPPPILPRRHLLKIARDREWGLPRARYVRLDRNEQVTPLPAAVRAEILAGLPDDLFNAYPDPRPLYEKLSRHLAVGTDRLFITSGSDAAIRRVFETFVDPGDTVVFADPTYPMYEVYCRLYQAYPVRIPHDDRRQLPLERLFAALSARPRLLALVNPAQPTGTSLPMAALRALATEAAQVGTILLVDEAYFPFFPETALSWFHEYENVIVTRTFSKAGGIAGLRLGYLASNPKFVSYIEKTRGSHEVNAMAVAVGCYLLDHPEIEESRLRDLAAGRTVLCAQARDLGFSVPECSGNYQLIGVPRGTDPAAWIEALKQRGYLVKGPFDAPCIRDYIRVTLDHSAVMHAFGAALSAVAAELIPSAPFAELAGVQP